MRRVVDWSSMKARRLSVTITLRRPAELALVRDASRIAELPAAKIARLALFERCRLIVLAAAPAATKEE